RRQRSTLLPYTTLFRSEKTPKYTSTSQSNDNILPPGHGSDDGREDDQASDVEDHQNVEFNSSQRLLVSIMKSMLTRSYNLDPAVDRKSTRLNSSHVKIS